MNRFRPAETPISSQLMTLPFLVATVSTLILIGAGMLWSSESLAASTSDPLSKNARLTGNGSHFSQAHAPAKETPHRLSSSFPPGTQVCLFEVERAIPEKMALSSCSIASPFSA